VSDGLVTVAAGRPPGWTEGSPSPSEDALIAGGERLVLTRRGRLLADAVVRALLP